MQSITPCRKASIPTLSLLSLFSLAPVAAAEPTVNLRLSVGSSWQARNDVQIPNDDLGSRFSLEDAVGEGPVSAVRFELNWAINEKHGMRILLAPLSYTESATFSRNVLFAGESFEANQATEATYRFNSWRVGYHYSLVNSGVASLKVGATLKVRDAEIRLQQGDTESYDDDVGVVPLLYLAGSYKMSERWTFRADFDGLAGGPGRAIDLGAALDFALTPSWQIGAEVRVLDGGADTDDVYNFARFYSSAVAVSARF